MARYRKKPMKKSSFFTNVKKGVNLASKVASTAMTVARIAEMVNAEKQYYDINNSWATSGAPLWLLSGIPQGDDEGARTGNSIKLNSIYLQMSLGINASATQTNCRIILFEDKFQTGTAPVFTDLVQASSGANSINNVISPLNVDTTQRYRIIMDKRVALSSTGVRNRLFKKYVKIQKHVHYTGPAATNTYNNNIYLVFFHDEPTNAPTLNWWNRVGYYDN